MEITIKEATLEDMNTVQQLNLLLFEKEYDEYDKSLNMEWTFGDEGTDYYKKRIENGFIAIAIVDGKNVGYICGGLKKAEAYRKLPKVAELENMFVLDEFRSKGVGSVLYEEFLFWCRENNVGKVRVEATTQNSRAIRFYQKNGFKDYTLILESDL